MHDEGSSDLYMHAKHHRLKLSQSIFTSCASRVGRLGGKQEILIGSAVAKCKVGNLIHELGHTLGFFHEHSRPDRDNYVKIAFDLVRPGELSTSKAVSDVFRIYVEFYFVSYSSYVRITVESI